MEPLNGETEMFWRQNVRGLQKVNGEGYYEKLHDYLFLGQK